jgi:hypothetical protein
LSAGSCALCAWIGFVFEGTSFMPREVREVTIAEYCDQWHGKPQTAQVFHGWWAADLEVTECEKLEGKQQYRIRLSSGEYRVIDAHVCLFLELY